MAGDAVVRDWDPLFSRYCAFSTLRSLGYRTRVSVANTSDTLEKRAEPVRIRVSLFGPGGRPLVSAADCGSLKPGEYWMLGDVETFAVRHGVDVTALDGELFGIVHQTPESHAEAAARSGTIDVTMGELALWVGLGDDFVEYYDDGTGGTGGVFYQCPPFNDARFSSTWMTVCQSPKVLFEDGLNPYLLLLNVSSDLRHTRVGDMRMSLFAADGDRLGGGETAVPPFASRVISLRAMLAAPAYRGNALLLGVATTCTLIPFGFMHDERSMALAIDHTMPPGNYHSAWFDKGRRSAWGSDLLRRVREGRL